MIIPFEYDHQNYHHNLVLWSSQFNVIVIITMIIKSQGGRSLWWHNNWSSGEEDYEKSWKWLWSLVILICDLWFHCQIGDSGFIRSPNYPSAYPADVKCVWWLKAKSKGDHPPNHQHPHPQHQHPNPHRAAHQGAYPWRVQMLGPKAVTPDILITSW